VCVEAENDYYSPLRMLARRIVEGSFLSELEKLIIKEHLNALSAEKSDVRQNIKRRFETRLHLVDFLLPIAWHFAAIAAEEIMPEQFLVKLSDPENSDHNRQHLAQVGNNLMVSLANNLKLPFFNEDKVRKIAMVGMFAAFVHDHLQIDTGDKKGHDKIGAVFAAGLMRLARLKHNLLYTEEMESLVFYACYWHSYPETRDYEGMASTAQILAEFGEQYGLETPGSLLNWLKLELESIGEKLENIGCNLTPEQLTTYGEANFIADRVFAADKRASYAPPFLSVLRTLGTGDNAFILKEHINQPAIDLIKKQNSKDTVLRTIFECFRDLRSGGMDAFEAAWLEKNMRRKLDYLALIARAMITGDFEPISNKFEDYKKQVLAQSRGNFESCRDVLGLIEADKQKALKLLREKAEELKASLNDLGMSNDEFLVWFNSLIIQVLEFPRIRAIGRTNYVPELPVYCRRLRVLE